MINGHIMKYVHVQNIHDCKTPPKYLVSTIELKKKIPRADRPVCYIFSLYKRFELKKKTGLSIQAAKLIFVLFGLSENLDLKSTFRIKSVGNN